jgi:hypothetical protein
MIRETPAQMRLCLFLTLLPVVVGDADLDARRTGSYYTDYPIYRGSSSNVVRVSVGTPGIDALLTLCTCRKTQLTTATNVPFVQIASDQCTGCTSAKLYVRRYNITKHQIQPFRFFDMDCKLHLRIADQSSARDQVNVIVYPQSPEDTLTFTSRLGTDIILDARGQDQVSYPVSAIGKIESGRDGGAGGLGEAVTLGTAGFFGLGIHQVSHRLTPLTVGKQAAINNSQHVERG